MDVDLCIFCEHEVIWEDEAVSCDVCKRWQHRLCFTGITQKIYTAANQDQAEFEFVCGPCQYNLQPHHDNEYIIEDLPGTLQQVLK